MESTPNNEITIVQGWASPKSSYLEAHQNGKLLKLVTELSAVCNLSCPGCFVHKVGDKVSDKGKGKRNNELSYDEQISLLHEASELGAKTVDLVGAGEPTLDRNFERYLEEVENLGMNAVVFTHAATKTFSKENLSKYVGKPISFFVKLWSLDETKMNHYVRGSVSNYAAKRDAAIKNLKELGFMDGEEVSLDRTNKRVTRVGADILVMRSNIDEIPDIFRYCREMGIMPEIKTYIPQGPTKLDQLSNDFKGLSDEEQAKLKEDAVTMSEFSKLREELIRIDQEEFGNPEMHVVYPQGTFCTQSTGSLYVTIDGRVLSCVGTGHVYETYKPGVESLRKVIGSRVETVGVGCMPRFEDAKRIGDPVSAKTAAILTE